MSDPLAGLGAARPASFPPLAPGGAEQPAEGSPFGKLLAESIGRTSSLEQSAQVSIENFAAGDDVQMSEVFSAVKKADLALRTMLQVRNKLLEAYDEIKNLRM